MKMLTPILVKIVKLELKESITMKMICHAMCKQVQLRNVNR